MQVFEYLIILSSAFVLASACGFRVFVPPMLISLIYKLGIIELNETWNWLRNPWVFSILAIATLIEVFAYYLPWLDHLLDVFSTPSAIAAGTLLSAISLEGVNPSLQWFLAVVGGGSSAAIIQASSVSIRLASSLSSAGFGNLLISSIELFFAISIVLIVIFFPIFSLLFIFFFVLLAKKVLRRLTLSRIFKK
tara:strand:- start:509 stop:1087 length:579 start_codon:yes stop_codon:yes gene_type:complete